MLRDESPVAPGDRIRVLLVSQSEVVWGLQRSLLRVAPALVERGVEPVLAARPGAFADAWQAAGLTVEPLLLPSHAGLRRSDGSGRRPGPLTLGREATDVLVAAWRVAGAARALAADVIQSDGLDMHVDTALAGRLARRPTVLSLHDLVVPGLGRRMLAAAARLATGAMANSSATASLLAGSARGRLRIVHPGVDLERFRPGAPAAGVRAELAHDPASPIVAIVGRVDPHKGVDTAVHAVAELRRRRPGVQLAVVGDPFNASAAWAEALRREAVDRLGPAVRFVPARSDVPDVLRSVDVLVNCSTAEPFGLTLLEAQACGTPVVATEAGGAVDLVAHERTGLLVPPRDPSALARALDRLLGDTELAEQVRTAGLRQAERLGVEQQADAMVELYRHLVSTGRGRARGTPRTERRPTR